LATDVKNTKRGFYKCIGDNRKTMQNVGPWRSKTGDLVTQDMEKAEVLSTTLASVFTSKTGLQESQRPGGKSGARQIYPLWKKVREYLSKPVTYKSMGPDRRHPRVLRKVVDVIVRPLSIFDQSW